MDYTRFKHSSEYLNCSTVATLTAIVAIPSLYNYMQHVQSSLQTEVDFCKHRTSGLFEQYERMQQLKGVRGGLVKRQAGYGTPDAGSSLISFSFII